MNSAYLNTHCYLAPAKLNLSLKVTGKRADGYHLLESLFCLINLYDLLQFQVTQNDQLNFLSSHAGITEENNLILSAAKKLKVTTNCSLGVNIKLQKNIPMGAGLGGGSSNAATTLIALNHLWNTKLSTAELIRLASEIGADVPFFIHGHNAYASGIGEKLDSVELAKSFFIVVYPNINVSTKQIFNNLNLTQLKTPCIIDRLDEGFFENDLQQIAFTLCPEIRHCYELVARFGKACMTGSGSSIFLKTHSQQESLAIKDQLPKNYQMYCVESLTQHPLNYLKKQETVGESSSG